MILNWVLLESINPPGYQILSDLVLHILESRLETRKARFLEYNYVSKKFKYVIRPIADFNGKTLELVGPHVNGNKHQVEHHAYIVHGSVEVTCNWKTHSSIKEWLDNEGLIYEGIVIHDLGNNKLYKCHRGHLGGSFIWEGCKLPMEE